MRQKTERMTIAVHIMISPEDGVYNAVCLEMGLAMSAPTPNAAESDMVQLIFDHIRGCLEEGRPQDILVPAPPEYWSTYAEAVASDSCEQLTRSSLPETSVYERGEAISRWTKKVEAYSFVCAGVPG